MEGASEWAGGVNPLDIGFGDGDAPEPVEKHRSSDSVGPRAAALAEGIMDLDPVDIPDLAADFDLEQELPPRMSEAPSMHSLPGTLRSSMDESSSVLNLQLTASTMVPKAAAGAKQAAKKRKAALLQNGNAELSKDVLRQWISSPEMVADTLREPRPLPRNRRELAMADHQRLHRRGQLAQLLTEEPLSGYVPPSLRALIAAAGAAASTSPARKRKQPEGDEGQAGEARGEASHAGGVGMDESHAGDLADTTAPLLDDMEFQPPDMDCLPDGDEDARVVNLARPSHSDDRLPSSLVDGIGEEERDEGQGEVAVDGEEEENQHAMSIEQQERTRKVVLMLQRCFRKVCIPLSKSIAPACKRRGTARWYSLCSKRA